MSNAMFVLRLSFIEPMHSKMTLRHAALFITMTMGITALSYVYLNLHPSILFAQDGSGPAISNYVMIDNFAGKGNHSTPDGSLLHHKLDHEVLGLGDKGVQRNAISSLPNDMSAIRCNESDARRLLDLDCRRRLPQVIGIGAKKSGTGAMAFFLRSHPAIAFTRRGEIHYWDWYPQKGVNWYLSRMPMSSQYQVTMEKTPAYFVGLNIPSAIARDVSPDVKLLLILRDPVKRAISDYTHVISMYPHLSRPHLKVSYRRPVYPHTNITYIVRETFEESVLNADGSVNTHNAFIFTGMYSTHLRNWLKVFPLKQILIIDGEEFVSNPNSTNENHWEFSRIAKVFWHLESVFWCGQEFLLLSQTGEKVPGQWKGENTSKRQWKRYSEIIWILPSI